MGVKGCFSIPDSLSGFPFTNICPKNTVLPASGKEGQAMVKSTFNSSIIASVTGPIFPSFVESNVEQYLNMN